MLKYFDFSKQVEYSNLRHETEVIVCAINYKLFDSNV